MSNQLFVLCLTAAGIGFFHTVIGPDHYLPFIVMSKARKWTVRKTLLVTALCGIGHVAGSIILGMVGIFAGIALGHLEFFEEIRGNVAAWLLIAFGFVYGVWGIWRGIRNRPHTHPHFHGHGVRHAHVHSHRGEHVHVHEPAQRQNLTPWILFIIFVFGPCEPLIPLLMYPAATESIWGVVLVASVFSLATISTMTAITLVSVYGLNIIRLPRLERFTHALAGGAIFISGVAIQFLGL